MEQALVAAQQQHRRHPALLSCPLPSCQATGVHSALLLLQHTVLHVRSSPASVNGIMADDLLVVAAPAGAHVSAAAPAAAAAAAKPLPARALAQGLISGLGAAKPGNVWDSMVIQGGGTVVGKVAHAGGVPPPPAAGGDGGKPGQLQPPPGPGGADGATKKKQRNPAVGVPAHGMACPMPGCWQHRGAAAAGDATEAGRKAPAAFHSLPELEQHLLTDHVPELQVGGACDLSSS